MGWSRRSNVPDQGNPNGEQDPLADNMRMKSGRQPAPTEPLDTERNGSIFDQQTVVDTNFAGRSQARRQRQMSSPFTTQQLGTWAADPNNSRKLLTIGGVVLGLLLLLALFYVYNRSGDNTATSDSTGIADASADSGGALFNEPAQASASADLGGAVEQVPAVPNSDPAQQAPPATESPFIVTGTETQGLFLRRDHVVDSANILGTLPEGTRVQGLGEEFDDGTRKWRKVRSEQFGEGWVAAEYLQPAP